jgi:hypothetical protein
MPIYEWEFEILSKITDIETIAVGSSIRTIERLRRRYGGTRWRKKKGTAYVRLYNGDEFWAEVHYYECRGVGIREPKIKLPEDEDDE